MSDMSPFEEAFAQDSDDVTLEVVASQMIRLLGLATNLYEAICDNAEDTPAEVLAAAEDWSQYLFEVAGP